VTPDYELTRLERKIGELLVEGLSNREIARALGRSDDRGIRHTLSELTGALFCDDRVQLRVALRDILGS